MLTHVLRIAAKSFNLAVPPLILSSLLFGCSLFCRLSGNGSQETGENHLSDDFAPTLEIENNKDGPIVISHKNLSDPISSAQIWLKRGSADETEELHGIAGLCSELFCHHQMPPEGISVSAWASHDVTVCEFSSPRQLSSLLSSHISKLLSTSPDLNENEVLGVCSEAEKRWRVSRGSRYRQLFELFFKTAFPEHPYSRSPLSPSPCSGHSPSEVQQICSAWFDPELMTISLSGNISAKNVSSALNSFPDRHEGIDPDVRSLSSRLKGPYIGMTTTNSEKASVAIGFVLPMAEKNLYFPIEVLLSALTEGRTSRLKSKATYGRGIFDENSGFLFSGKRGGALLLHASCPANYLEETTRTLLSLPLSLHVSPLTEAEFSRGKQHIARQFLMETKGSAGIARSIGYGSALFDEPQFQWKTQQILSEMLSSQSIHDAQQIFTPERLVITVVVPECRKRGCFGLPSVKTADGQHKIDLQEIESDLRKSIEPLVSPPEIEAEQESEDIFLFKTQIGASVLIRQEKQSEQIAIRATVTTHDRQASGYSVGHLEALRKNLRSAIATESPITIPENRHGLTASGIFPRSDATKGLMDTIEALGRLQHPFILTNQEVDGLSKATRGAHNQPLNIGRATLGKALYPTTPLLRERSGLMGSDFENNLKALRTSQQTLIRPDRIVITIVGPVDPFQMAKSADFVLASLASSPREESQEGTDPVPENRPEGSLTRRFAESPSSHLWIAFPLEGIGDLDWPALEVVRTLLESEEGQLHRRIADRGIASEIAVDLWMGRSAGHFSLYLRTSPEEEQNVLNSVQALFEEFRSAPLTSFELERARNRAALRISSSLGSESQRAEALERSRILGLSSNEILEGPERIISVTQQQVQNIFRQSLVREYRFVVIVGPEPDEFP